MEKLTDEAQINSRAVMKDNIFKHASNRKVSGETTSPREYPGWRPRMAVEGERLDLPTQQTYVQNMLRN